MAGPDLGKMVGPLPLGGWIVVLVGGVGFTYIARKRAGNAPTTTAPDTSGDASGLTAGGVIAMPSAGGATGAYSTNEEWLRGVENMLIGKGYDPVLVDRTLRDYLDGVQLDVQEGAVIAMALTLGGPAPNPPGAGPAPLTIPPNSPPQHGDTSGGFYNTGQTSAKAVSSVLRHDGMGGYTLDSWGGIHPFASSGTPTPPQPVGGPYWPGQDVATGIVLNSNDSAGYVLDFKGAQHPFTVPPMPYGTLSASGRTVNTGA